MAEFSELSHQPQRRLIVGLGNPGKEYEGSRHNIGFEVLDRLAQVEGLRFRRQERIRGLGPVKARIAELRGKPGQDPSSAASGEETLLIKPWTWMNLSGDAVAAYARFYGIPPESIFVIYDDLHLPLGRIRIRPGGSPGGHNGIKSLSSRLGSEGFPRLRAGIAVTGLDESAMADPDFVLGRFGVEELTLLEPVLEHAVRATQGWLHGRPLDELMSQYNAAIPALDDGARAEDGAGPSDLVP